MRARLKEQRFRQEWEYKFRLGLDRFRIGFAEIRRYEHRFRIVSIYIYIGEFLDRYMGVTTFAHRAPCYSFFPSSCVRSDFLTMYSVYRVTQYRTQRTFVMVYVNWPRARALKAVVGMVEECYMDLWCHPWHVKIIKRNGKRIGLGSIERWKRLMVFHRAYNLFLAFLETKIGDRASWEVKF